MKCIFRLAGAASALVLAACSGQDNPVSDEREANPPLTAATLGQQSVSTPADYLLASPYSSADVENGRRQAQICRACHSFDVGGAHMIGPALSGFFGRQAGSVSGFSYSAAINDVQFAWTPRALDAWLAAPGRFLPGNSMAFAGVMRQSDRDDLIAYLLVATDPKLEKQVVER